MMNKKVKLIVTMACYAAVLCAAIYLAPLLFRRTAQPEAAAGKGARPEIVYGGISLPGPLYPSAPGISVEGGKYAQLDYSNASQGYVTITCIGDSGAPVMKMTCGEAEYTYTLSGEDVIPLTCGDGNYTFKIYQQLRSGKYKSIMTKTLTVELENQLLPYLYPSQLVNYSPSSLAVEYAAGLCGALEGDLEKLKAVYAYIIGNIVYDYKKAAAIEKGYIPSIDSTHISKSGICFDYSVMMAAMLRTQLIPAKLVMGYLHGTSVFHAWNEVYLKNSGWVTVHIFIDTDSFSMLDSTLGASQDDEVIAQKLNDSEVYLPTHKY